MVVITDGGDTMSQVDYKEALRAAQEAEAIIYSIIIVPIEAGVPGEPIEVWTRDISRTGIGIITSQKMKAGDRFVVHFPRADATAPLGLVCTIKSCSQLSKGVYSIGAVFEGMRLVKPEPAPAATAAPAPAATPSNPAAPAPTPAAAA